MYIIRYCTLSYIVHYQILYIIGYCSLFDIVHCPILYIIRYCKLCDIVHYRILYIIRYCTLSDIVHSPTWLVLIQYKPLSYALGCRYIHNRTQGCRFYVSYMSRLLLHIWKYIHQIRTSVAKIDETSWDTEPVPFQLDELEASTSGQSSQRDKKMWKAASFGSQSSGTDVDSFEIDWDICFVCQIVVCVWHK